ncbi:hypothetical protein MMARV_C021P1 [viral metagenome]|uniref:Uncharacterized protein n=1 Tax=viral metagenome TaxID=1070528 RepID=A0A6L2ZJC9_9ZZZZ
MSLNNNTVSVSALSASAVLPLEMWGAIVENLSAWDAACIVRNVPMCSAPVYQALLARANQEYSFGCTREVVISSVPCHHQRTCEILSKSAQFSFVCREHISSGCNSDCSVVIMSRDEVAERQRRHEAERAQRKYDHMYGPFATEHEMMVIDDQNAETSAYREYLRYGAELFYMEEDFSLANMFAAEGTSAVEHCVERTRGGMDAAGAEAQADAQAAPMPVEDEVPQDGPVNEEPTIGLPPGSEEPNHPGPDVPLDPRVTNGDDFGNIPNTEDAADPVDAVATNGWFEYPYAQSGGQTSSYAGLITQANPTSEYITNISDRFRSISPQFEELERNIRVASGSGVQSYLVQTLWGFGPRSAASLLTQSANADARTVAFWTTNPQSELIPVSEDTIMYDTLAGLSVEGQMVRLNTTFNDNMITDLYGSIGDRDIAQRYYDHVVTAAVAGSNYVAFLTICYTRLVSLKIMAEQNQPAQMRVEGDTLNANILLDAVEAPLATRRVVDAVLRSKPTNAVMLPHGSNDLDVETMLYLMGHGRVIKSVTNDEDEVAVFSPFDRFHPDTNFKLLGLVGERAIGRFPPGNLEFQIDFGQAFDLLNRYINQNDLWDQFAIARNIALGMMFSRTFSSSVGLPKPYHSRDLALNGTHTGANQHGRRRVMEFKESFHAIIATGTWHCAAMEETLFESVVNVMEESAGIGPRAPNFYASIDTMQDDFDLEYKTAMVCLPVVERMTGTASDHIHQYVSKSNIAFMKAISFGWESKPIRISSYLALEIVPEDKNFKFLFDKSARTALLKQEKFTWREAVLTSFVCHSQWGPSEQHRYYGEFYDDNISALRETPPFYGYLGRSQLEHLEGAPTIWNTSTAATPIEFTKPASYTRATRDLNDEEAMQVDALWATMKAALEAASAENDAEEDEDDDDIVYPQPTANPTQQGQRFELHEPKGKEAVRHVPEPEQQRAGTDRVIPASQWQKPKHTVKVSEKVAVHRVEPRNYFQSLSSGSNLIGFNPSNTTPGRDPPQQRASLSPGALKKLTPKQKSKAENAYLDSQIKAVRAERREFEQRHRGGMNKKSTKEKKKIVPAVKRDDVEQLCSRMITDLQFRTELLSRLPETEDESKAVDFLYPRGKDGSLKRAVYTIGTLLRKLRCDKKITAEQKADVSLFLTSNVGGKNAWAVAVVMFITLNTLTPECYAMLKNYGLLTTPYNLWNDKWSKINDLFRNQMDSESWAYSETDFPQCLYIAGFVGRPHREADWEAENALCAPYLTRKSADSLILEMKDISNYTKVHNPEWSYDEPIGLAPTRTRELWVQAVNVEIAKMGATSRKLSGIICDTAYWAKALESRTCLGSDPDDTAENNIELLSCFADYLACPDDVSFFRTEAVDWLVRVLGWVPQDQSWFGIETVMLLALHRDFRVWVIEETADPQSHNITEHKFAATQNTLPIIMSMDSGKLRMHQLRLPGRAGSSMENLTLACKQHRRDGKYPEPSEPTPTLPTPQKPDDLKLKHPMQGHILGWVVAGTTLVVTSGLAVVSYRHRKRIGGLVKNVRDRWKGVSTYTASVRALEEISDTEPLLGNQDTTFTSDTQPGPLSPHFEEFQQALGLKDHLSDVGSVRSLRTVPLGGNTVFATGRWPGIVLFERWWGTAGETVQN